VGGTANSDLFVLLDSVQPGVRELSIVLRYDPQIVDVVDADGIAANGTQIAAASLFGVQQTIVENRVDPVQGEVELVLAQRTGSPIWDTGSWQKTATITWRGKQEGDSVLAVHDSSNLKTTDGKTLAVGVPHNGTAFARPPGQVEGRVRLQGRAKHGATMVSSALTQGRVDTAFTTQDGSFRLATSHGEGFYQITASATGYLSAAGSRPVKLTVGSAIHLGETTLVGGDTNGDDRIDVRDLSFVAYHMGASSTQTDLNRDGRVDILDLALVARNFGRSGPTTWVFPD
jgi:hypothetical protein